MGCCSSYVEPDSLILSRRSDVPVADVSSIESTYVLTSPDQDKAPLLKPTPTSKVLESSDSSEVDQDLIKNLLAQVNTDSDSDSDVV